MKKDNVIMWISGLLVGVSLMIYDELLTLAQYCQHCKYPIPLLGAFDLYEASYLPFGLTILAFILIHFRDT